MSDAHEPERGDIPLADEGLVVAMLCADAQATVGAGYEREIGRIASDVRQGPYVPETYADDVADGVQQHMHDCHIDTTWPSCPRHPNHPMGAYRGVWSCAGDPIAPLGALSILKTHEETSRYGRLSHDRQLRVLALSCHTLTRLRATTAPGIRTP